MAMKVSELPIRLRCFTTGVVRPKARERGLRRYVLDAWQEETLPVNVFVVEHPDGVCLFDCGQTARAAIPGHLPRWHPFLRLARFELTTEDEAGVQLRRHGLEPEAVRWVVLSHLHTDHVGGIDAFRNADVLVTRTEWQLAAGLRGRLRGYLPQHWPAGLVPTLVDFAGPPLGPFPGSFNLTDDGRLVLVPTPGHTRGHMSMLVDAGKRGYLLCGDLVQSPAALAATSPAIGEFCEREAVLALAAHDPEAARRLV